MNRKRIALVVIVLALIVAVGGVFLAVPQRYFGQGEVRVDTVWRTTADGEQEYNTAQVDVEQLELLLELMQTGRVPEPFSPYRADAVTYEISGVDDGGMVHILLGKDKFGYVYTSADRGGYRVRNVQVWLGLLDRLCQNS